MSSRSRESTSNTIAAHDRPRVLEPKVAVAHTLAGVQAACLHMEIDNSIVVPKSLHVFITCEAAKSPYVDEDRA
jgi:hypothetical protein